MDKSMVALTVLVAVLAVIAVGLIAVVCMYHVVDFQLYPRNAETLDLREKVVSVSHYEKLKRAMPDCDIQWNIPFQGGVLADDAQHVAVTVLTDADVAALAYAEELKTVDASGCTDYPRLEQLRQLLPQVEVRYQVTVGGEAFPWDSESICVTGASEAEILNLRYLPELTRVAIRGNGDFDQLRNYCLNTGLEFAVQLGDTAVPYDAQTVTVENLTEEDLPAMGYLTHMKQLHLVNPQAGADQVKALEKTFPQTQVSWEVDVLGQRVRSDAIPEEMDLSAAEITDLKAVEAALAYLPGLKQVFLGECGIDNEELAAYRDRVREDYKVVWELRLEPGKKKLRTDITYFFPARDGYIFNDKTSHNLRYCEDLICVDVGHLGVSDTSFLETLVNLEYLILAHTGVQYIDGIENCKKLKFLELDWTGIRDLTPLMECTALEDLNIGKTYPDVTPLTKMPWLKNVYMIMGNVGQAWKITQACPDTRVVTSGNATVAGNWRKLPNYYAMRDALGANYMHG